MAVPSFINSSLHGLATRTNIVVTKPASTADNDVIVFTIGMANSAGGTPPAATPPAGLTQIGTMQTVVTGSVRLHLYMYWKRAASEGASYTFTHTSTLCMGCAFTYRGCVTTEAPVSSLSTFNTGTGTTATATGLTTLANDNLLLYIGGNLNGTATLSPPTGMTERADEYLYVAEVAQATLGATGNKTQTQTDGDNWAANLIVLKSLADPVAVTGQLKYYTGSVWAEKPVKYWTGSAWVTKPLKYWNGSTWTNA